MKIELDNELRISKFRRILLMFRSSNVIKILIDGQYYDISKVMDKEDVTIFEVGDLK